MGRLSVFGGETSMSFFFGKHNDERPAMTSRSYATVQEDEPLPTLLMTSSTTASDEEEQGGRRFTRFLGAANRRNRHSSRSIRRKNRKGSSSDNLQPQEDPTTPLRQAFAASEQARCDDSTIEVMGSTDNEVEVLVNKILATPPCTPRVTVDATVTPPHTPDTASTSTVGVSKTSSTTTASTATSSSPSVSWNKSPQLLPRVLEVGVTSATLYPSFTSLSLLIDDHAQLYQHPEFHQRMVVNSCRRHLRVMYGSAEDDDDAEEGQEVNPYYQKPPVVEDFNEAQELVGNAIRAGNLEEAIQLTAFMIAHHPQQGSTLRSSLVVLYLAKDEPAKALQQNVEHINCMAAAENPTPAEGAMAVFLLLQHGLAQMANRELDEALAAWREAVHMSMGLHGYSTPIVALLLSYLGIGHFCHGNLSRGAQLMEESLELQRQMLSCGGKDASVDETLYRLANTMGNLSVVCEENGDTDRAVSLLDEAVAFNDSISLNAQEVSMLMRRKIVETTSSQNKKGLSMIPTVVDIPGKIQHDNSVQELLRKTSTQSGVTLNTLRTVDMQLYERQRLAAFFGSVDGLPNRSLSSKAIDPSALVCYDLLMLGPLGPLRWTNSERVQETVLSWFDGRASSSFGSRREAIPVDVDDENVFNANLYLQQIHVQTVKHLEQDEIEEAIELLESTLRSHRSKYGESHHLIGSALQNIGMVHLFADEYEKALEKFDEAFEIRSKILGPDHPDVYESLCKGALVHFAMGDLWKAHDAFWAIYDRMKASGHPVLYKILNNIAITTYELGDIVNAVQVFQGALESQVFVTKHKPMCKDSLKLAEEGRAYLLENLAFISFDCGIDKHALHYYDAAKAILSGEEEKFVQRLRCIDDNIEHIHDNGKCTHAKKPMDSLLLETVMATWCQAVV